MVLVILAWFIPDFVASLVSRSNMKIICAGLQKTGTKTMAGALRILGYNVHDIFDQYFLDEELWDKVRDDTATPEDYKRVLGDVDAVTDYPACGLWEEIFKAFPNSKVILMERSTEDEWYHSLRKQCEKMDRKRLWKRLGIPDDVFLWLTGPTRTKYEAYSRAFHPGCIANMNLERLPVGALSRAKYRQHNNYVKAVCPKEQLLIYNVKDGWEPLCKFLNLPVPNQPFPFLNKNAAVVDEVARCEFKDYGFMKNVYRESMIRFGFMFVTILAILLYFVERCISSILS